MKHRFKIYTFVLSLLAAVGMSSCVYDSYLEEEGNFGQTFNPSGKLSIRLRIKSTDSASRAVGKDGELLDGDELEHAIGNDGNFIIFFDKNKKFFSAALLDLYKKTNPSEQDVVERTYTATLLPDDYDEDPYENLPRYCLVVLNGSEFYDKFTNYDTSKTVNDVLEELWIESADPKKLGWDKDGYFVMSNSTYFDGSNAKVQLSDVRRDMIFDPSNPARVTLFPEGEELYEAPVLTVYVERMLAKCSFEVDFDGTYTTQKLSDGTYAWYPDYNKMQQMVVFSEVDQDEGPKYVARNWRVLITGWGMNGYAKNEYLFKQVDDKDYFSFAKPSPGSSSWQWKDPLSHRTYWAEDKDYDDTNSYPWQYRTSVNEIGIESYNQNEAMNANLLKNYSYNDLDLAGVSFNKQIYVPENTYEFNAPFDRRHDGRGDLLAGTHLLVGARLQLSDASLNNYITQDLWRDRDGFYYTNQYDVFRALLYGFNASLTSQKDMRYVYYDWNSDGYGGPGSQFGEDLYAKVIGEYHLSYATTPNATNPIEITDNVIKSWGADFMEEGYIRRGDGRRLPWPSHYNLFICDSNNQKAQIAIYRHVKPTNPQEGHEYNEVFVRYANENDIKSMMFEWIGAIDHFCDGAMYYCKTNNLLTVDNTNKALYSRDICGTVRNAWYSFVLRSISNLGTPIDRPDQPIVPDPSYHYDQLNISVDIKEWHHEDTWAPVIQ